MKKTYTLIAVNIFLLSLFFVGLGYNLITPFFVNDTSHISIGIAVVLFINIGLTVYTSWRDSSKINDYLDWIATKFLFFGIMGTLIGLGGLFHAVATHMSGGSIAADGIFAIIFQLLIALQTMFNCTLIGLGAKLWSDLNNKMVMTYEA